MKFNKKQEAGKPFLSSKPVFWCR